MNKNTVSLDGIFNIDEAIKSAVWAIIFGTLAYLWKRHNNRIKVIPKNLLYHIAFACLTPYFAYRWCKINKISKLAMKELNKAVLQFEATYRQPIRF